MNILNQKINRSRGSRRSAVMTGVLVLALALPISTSGLWNAKAEEKSKKSQQAQTEEAKKQQSEKMKQKEEEMKKAQMSAEEKEKQKAISAMSAKEKISFSWEKIRAQEGSAAGKVGMIIKEKGVEAGLDAFYQLKKADESEYYFKESEFNTLGYLFLYYGKLDLALAVFQLNVKEYPDSWNVYDSLGEAYLVAKKFDEAKKYYSTALEMNPEAESAQKALMKLESLAKETS